VEHALKKTYIPHVPRPKKAAIAFALGLLSSPGWALDYVWQGGEGLWSDANRWTLLGVPGVGDTATLGSGTLQLVDVRNVDGFTINGGQFGGAGALNTGAFAFNGGRIGYSTSTGGGSLNVLGSSTFNGAASLIVDYSHTLNLNGNSTWTAGNGRIQVEGSYTQGNVNYPTARFIISNSATFTDEGAASAGGYKVLGLRAVIDNAGTYHRNGLGTTGIINLNNTGTVNVNSGTLLLQGDGGNTPNTRSSGTINVATGSVLQFFSNSNADFSFITGGRISNSGLVRVSGTLVDIDAASQINGAWQVDGNTAVMLLRGNHTIDSLVQDTGYIAGPGTLTTGSLVFNAGRMGYSTETGGGVLNVNGSSTFNGTGWQTLDYSHTLNLNGNSTWTAGDGRIAVSSAYQTGNVVYPSSRLNISAGTTFTDQGAASASGFKTLGIGGVIENNGTYVRTGFGATVTAGFVNRGTLDIQAGTIEVDDAFRNQGVVKLAAGTLLGSYRDDFRNDGTITGTGTLRTWFANRTLDNRGTLDPGSLAGAGASGTLTVNGNLGMAPASTLRIDFDATGAIDLLAVTGNATWGGVLAVWAAPGQQFELGETFTVATFAQGTSSATFSGFAWLGEGDNPFSLVYAPQSVSLLVTTAVPEPATVALWALGLFGISCARRAGKSRWPA
jgi:hypothetical protein